LSRGTELVMMLATEQETQRASRFAQVKGWLGEHLASGYGPTGWTQEGNGYLGYAGGFLLPAIYALQSTGDTSLDAAFNAVQFWQLPLYAGAFDANQSSLQFGVGNHDIDNEGFTSAVLNAVPAEMLPYYQYFYDLHRGIHNPAADAQKFDNRRAGSTWALIYYPLNGQAQDPSDVLSPVLVDSEKGAYYFRDRWQDANDTLIFIGGDFKAYPRSWDEADAFALNLFAYGTRYIGGPGNSQNSDNFSTLLVNGQVGDNRSTGAPGFFTETPHGGYVIVEGGETYAGLGVEAAERHLWVDYSGDAGTVLLSTLDQLQDTDNNTYTWQLNLGLATDDGNIVATSGNDNGVPTFLLESQQGSYLKGWILEPSDASVLAGDPLQVITQGSNADIWTVMVVGTGVAPVAEVAGTGIDTVLTVGNARVYYDSASDRIIQESIDAITTLAGTTEADTLTGNAGRNILVGGAGQDLLTSGSGLDVFVYNSASEGGDTITDWTVDDLIQVSASGFGGGLVAGTPLQSGDPSATGTFVLGATPVGTSANFLYDNGVLSFDPDGTGTQGAVAIATLTGAPSLATQQIQVTN
ncbi:MAG: calcium-binding protein, partial [Leptolyngbya sp. SIO1D8]|nr:calcium-binding protein [Leptolyngbya sp. SIO1D8]